MNYVVIAQQWCKQNTEHIDSRIMMILAGQVYGWKNCLRDAQHKRPGVTAVDVDENVFIAEGGKGYDYNGAKC